MFTSEQTAGAASEARLGFAATGGLGSSEAALTEAPVTEWTRTELGATTMSKPKRTDTLVTRFELVDYMKQREWWAWSQSTLLYTLCLWIAFMVQVWQRADVYYAFSLHDSIVQYVEGIMAHPSLSGMALKTREEMPASCRCGCLSRVHPEPTGPCDSNAEVLDFLGLLPEADMWNLLAGACADMPLPLGEFQDSLDANISNFTCQDWVGSYSSETGGDVSEGALTACNADNFEFYLRNHSADPAYENDTLTKFLFAQGDFRAPWWRCPSTCGVCRRPLEYQSPPMGINDLASQEDIWYWVEHGLLPSIFGYGAETHHPGIIQKRNLLVGGIRARQRRARTPFECRAPDKLKEIYVPQCRAPEPAQHYGARVAYSVQVRISNVVESVTNTDPGLGTTAASAAADSSYSEAKADVAGVFDAHFSIERPVEVARRLAGQLRREGWLDQAAQGLDVQGLFINLEAKFYAVMEVSFFLDYDGRVRKEINVRVFPVVEELSVVQYIPEIIWVILVGILLVQELRQIATMAWERQICEYCTDFWNIVDWVSILLGAGIVLFYFDIVGLTMKVNEAIIALPRAPLPADLDVASYEAQWSAVIDQSLKTYESRTWYMFLLFLYSSVITARCLKGCVGQEKLSMIQKAIFGAFYFIFHFQIICIVCFVNFAIGGHALFGPDLVEWSTIAKSSSTTLQMIFGSLQFERMYRVLPYSATIWLVLFIFTMVFLLLNLLTAIMMDHYHSFRGSVGPTDTIWHDVRSAFRDMKFRLEWRREKVLDGEYREALLANPYDEIVPGLIENAELPDEVERMSRRSCLGMRIAQRMRDVKSVEGLKAEAKVRRDPAAEFVTEKEVRKLCGDPWVSEHLIEECAFNVQRKRANEVHVRQAGATDRLRKFLQQLREHREALVKMCDHIETGIYEEDAALMDGFDRLEGSVQDTLGGFAELKEFKVDSLALPPPRLEFAGTSLRDTFTNQLGWQQPRQGTVTEEEELRGKAQADDPPLAIGYDDGYGYGTGTQGYLQPALGDAGVEQLPWTPHDHEQGEHGHLALPEYTQGPHSFGPPAGAGDDGNGTS